MTWPPPVLAGASRIGLGLAAIGRPAYITTGRGRDLGADRTVGAMQERASAVLDAAYQSGIRYVDAARSYGNAEAFLAQWLQERAIAPRDVAVGSKWGYTYVGEWKLDAVRHEIQDLSVAALRRQIEESRSILGPHLALYQVHSATEQNAVLYDPEVLGVLDELRAEGLGIGVTTTGPRQSATIDRAVELGLFDTVQATWNLLEPSSGPSLARAHAAGMTVIVKEALANGRLTGSDDQAELATVATDRALAPDTLAVRAALANPWADLVLSGAVTTAQLRADLRAERPDPVAPSGEPRAAGDEGDTDDMELLALAERLARPPETYWRERSQLPWT